MEPARVCQRSGHIVRGRSTSDDQYSHPGISGPHCAPRAKEIDVALMTGGIDKPYVHGLATGLAAKGIRMDVIGSDDLDSEAMRSTSGLRFISLLQTKERRGLVAKVVRVFGNYGRLLKYAATAKPRVFHILWNYKIQALDRTFVILFYRILGKKVVLTAHNVNAGKRDNNDCLFNRLTLHIQYRLVHKIFVHTQKMALELQRDFRVPNSSIVLIPFGINNAAPRTELTRDEARRRLGIGVADKTLLFFGAIRPYKGLEYLVDAFLQLVAECQEYRLVIAGSPHTASQEYFRQIERRIDGSSAQSRIIQVIRYIPDDDVELYFKAADISILPYTDIYQSGVLLLAYSFGLPVLAANVGSIQDDVVEGYTGFLCTPRDSEDLARKVRLYFGSELYQSLAERRQSIISYAAESHSWEVVADTTSLVYGQLLN